MKKLLTLTTTAVVGLSVAGTAPAYAYQCPALWAQIDKQLRTAQLSKAERSRVLALRNRGIKLHRAGDHSGSEAALRQALQILG